MNACNHLMLFIKSTLQQSLLVTYVHNFLLQFSLIGITYSCYMQYLLLQILLNSTSSLVFYYEQLNAHLTMLSQFLSKMLTDKEHFCCFLLDKKPFNEFMAINLIHVPHHLKI